MTRFLHTMYRIIDPERSREFCEALGMAFRRDLDIVRNGELEATNYFLGFPGDEAELELTFNHDGRSYELGTAYGHVASAWRTSMPRLPGSPSRGSSPSGRRTRCARGVRGSASCVTPIES